MYEIFALLEEDEISANLMNTLIIFCSNLFKPESILENFLLSLKLTFATLKLFVT